VSTAADADVLVIGAGPSGLLTAVDLARYGARARVVEHEPVPHRQARATAVQPGTLELLAQVGLADELLSASVHLRCARVLDQALAPVSEVAFAGAGCPWEFQASLPQWRTEELLAGKLAELGGTVERGVTATSLHSGDDSVTVGLRHADGSREQAEVAWVVGAGGAHSITRAAMAGQLAGSTYVGTALAADIAITCGVPRDGSALVATAAGYVLLAPLPDDRWITFIGDLSEEETARLERDTSAAIVAECIGRRIPAGVRLDDVGWASTFRMHRRMASRLAGERCFLLGDAGHLSSPFGGEGLNSGLHDSHNLAWKLATQLRGRAGPALLDSFAAERQSADEHVLGVSDQLHRLAHGAVEAARTGVRAAPPTPEQVAALVRSRSMLDVSYAASPLSGEYVASGDAVPPGPGPGERYPDRAKLTGTEHYLLLAGHPAADGAAPAALDRLRGRWRGLVEIAAPGGAGRPTMAAGCAAVLVRPDGHIGFRASRADAAGLAAVDRHLESYLLPVS
jgi:6-methylpretetramide 4-monooxygenase / 4-hydroxy-6-methylpretetramide 12a-monooxygenase